MTDTWAEMADRVLVRRTVTPRAEHAALVAAAREGHAAGRPAADVAAELPYSGRYAERVVARAYAQPG